MIAAPPPKLKTRARSHFNLGGRKNAKILVVCDPPSKETFERTGVLPPTYLGLMAKNFKMNGVPFDEVGFITPCPPIPPEDQGSAKREGDWLAKYHKKFMQLVASKFPEKKLVIFLGNLAGRQLLGHPVKITQVCGQVLNASKEAAAVKKLGCPVFGMLTPAHVNRRLELMPQFESDFKLIGKIYRNDWNTNFIERAKKSAVYEWCLDLQYWIDNPQECAAVDTESRDGRWYEGGNLLMVQFCFEPGKAIVVPLNCEYFPELSRRQRLKLIEQIRIILGRKSLRVTGHYLGVDLHMLRTIGVTVANWQHDSMQLAFVVDENMQAKDLANVTRQFGPMRLKGYSDHFDQTVDKSRMQDVPPDKILPYAGGDVDASLCDTLKLVGLAKKDRRNYRCYTRIQMPGLRLFNRMEQKGMKINRGELREFGTILRRDEKRMYDELIEQVPRKVLRRHADKKNGLSFNRDEFVRDIVFSREGFHRKPVVFTPSTRKLPPGDPNKIPSASCKEHLPYFDDVPWVSDFIKYAKIASMLEKYVGHEAHIETRVRRGKEEEVDVDEKGFWKYIDEHGYIHPSFFLHRTVTGRTASAYPNCVREDTLIRCRGGQKRIADITAGDMVWTHKGRWRRVLCGFVRPEQEMYEIHFSNGEVLRCTEEHRLLTEDGRWVTLRNVCIQKALSQQTHPVESNGSLSRVPANDGASSIRVGSGPSHSLCNPETGAGFRGASEAESVEILSVEEGQQESFVGATCTEPQGGLLRWAGLLNSGSPWPEVFRASNCVREDAGDAGRGFARASGAPSHRRGHVEQLPGQPRPMHTGSTQEDSLPLQENAGSVTIERVVPCGGYKVYDIEVEEDHSYEAAGCFSHNCQNWPKHGTLAKAFRRIFIPRKGYVFVEVDLSQAELRLAAWMALEEVMIGIYRKKGDIHTMTAATVMRIPLEILMSWKNNESPIPLDYQKFNAKGDKAAKTLAKLYEFCRQKAKAVNFGFLFGMGWKKFISYAKTDYQVEFTEQEAREIRNLFFQLYPNLVVWHDTMREFVREHKYVRALHGAVRHLPSIDSYDQNVRGDCERQAINFGPQRFSSDLGLMGLTRFGRDCDWSKMFPVNFIHDAGVLEVKEDYVEEAGRALKWYNENNPLKNWFGITPPMPILADISVGANLGEMKGMDWSAKCPDWYRSEEDDAVFSLN